MTYFELYDLKPAYFLNEAEIKSKFLQLSRKYHPDHFALNTDDEKIQADEMSSLNNKAFRILKHPDSRLKYLLELKQMIQDEEVYTLDQDFLMEMLDINDLVMEDPETAANQLDSIEKTIYQEIKSLLENYDHEKISPLELTQLKAYHYKKRYLWRIRENIEKSVS